jgi:hypothetical protein
MIGPGKPGSITSKIQKKFFEVARGMDKKYKDWLTYL